MAAFAQFPAPVQIRSRRKSNDIVDSHYCCPLRPSMRFAQAAPSAVAVAVATLLAAGALHPTALPPAARRGAPPAAIAALLSAALLRPNSMRRRRRNDFDPPRAVVLPPVEVTEVSNTRENSDVQSVFSASRREWDAPQPPNSSVQPQINHPVSESDSVTTGTSTVYSYSYGKSRKKEKKKDTLTSDESGRTSSSAAAADGAFSHMRNEFFTQPVEDVGTLKGEREPLSFEELAWEDEENSDDPMWQDASGGVSRVSRKRPIKGDPGREFEDEKEPPRPVSATTLMRQVVKAPMWVLAEVVLPVADVVALVWFDFKVWFLGLQERQSFVGERRYFLPELKRRREVVAKEEEEEEEGYGELSEEEMQIKQVQTAAKKVVKGVEGTVRKLFDDFL